MTWEGSRVLIKALFIDLDGVIRIWEADYIARVEAPLGLPRGAFAEVAFGPELLTQVTTGRISAEEWRAETGRRLRDVHPELDVAELIRRWDAAPARVDEEVLALVRTVRREVPVSLITNATSRLPLELRQLGIDDEFDYIFNTSELGVAKPDPEVFRIIMNRVGVEAAQSFFVDDHPENVKTAAALGMCAHLYKDVERLRRDLLDAGFPL